MAYGLICLLRFGHGPNRIVGITLALSMHYCSKIVHDVADMAEGDKQTDVAYHKEEMPSRIQSANQDRKTIREILQSCIDSLNPSDHPYIIINVVTGRITADTAS